MCCYLLSVFERAAVLQIGIIPVARKVWQQVKIQGQGLRAFRSVSPPEGYLNFDNHLGVETSLFSTTATSRDPGATATPREGLQ